MAGHLLPDRHLQRDFFVADIFDAAPKDDLASMEHPLFALKAGDRAVKEYKHNDVTVTVKPGVDGRATINDKDVWIYAISQLVEAINRGREDVGRTVRFVAYDFLVTTNRGVDGRSYERMADALRRLSGTRIETNIETASKRERAGFGLIDAWRVIERNKDDRMVAVEVTLPDWLWRAVKAMHVLTIHPDYFRIRRPLDRRLYELARKHCGSQERWRVSVTVLHRKSGSSSPLRNFRCDVKALAELNGLPGYGVLFNAETDLATFYSRSRVLSQAGDKSSKL